MKLGEPHLGVLRLAASGRIKTADALRRFESHFQIVGQPVSTAFGMIVQELIAEGLLDYANAESGSPPIIEFIWLIPKGAAALKAAPASPAN